MGTKPRILITGSSGFIGSNIMRTLKNHGEETCGLDNYSTYYSPSMKLEREIALDLVGATIDVDISNREKLRRVFEEFNPSIVINLAAQGGVRASKTDPFPYIDSNQLGFLNLIELSRDFGVSKFIYASSSSVYGDSTLAPFEESSLLPAPKSLYALSKLSNEIIAEQFFAPDMKRIGLRFFTVYGPWGRPDMAMFRILTSSILEREFVLTASKSVKRDFTYVDDLSNVVTELLRKEISDLTHEVINVAGGKPYSLGQLFSILEDFKMPLRVQNAEQDRLDVQLTHGSIKKLEAFGLPVPSSSLAYGVEQTMKWLTSIDRQRLEDWYDYNS